MKIYTFKLQAPGDKFPVTESVTSGAIVSATNVIMRNKKFQGFTIIEAYCGRKTGKVTQAGFVTYEYLEGKVIKAPDKPSDEPLPPTEFDGLLGEVDQQCSKKEKTHAE